MDKNYFVTCGNISIPSYTQVESDISNINKIKITKNCQGHSNNGRFSLITPKEQQEKSLVLLLLFIIAEIARQFQSKYMEKGVIHKIRTNKNF